MSLSNRFEFWRSKIDDFAGAHAQLVSGGVLALVYGADVIAPPAVSFDVFYCIPIWLMAWYGSARAAYVVCVCAMLAEIHNSLLDETGSVFPWLSAYRAGSVLVLFTAFCFAVRRVRRQMDQLQHSEKLLTRLAFHDRLTHLPNRPLLFDRLAGAIALARRNGRKVALLFLDLDGFKPINDRFGHREGDEVLKVVAKRLQGCVRESDTVARLGGDEFAVVLGDLADGAAATRVAQEILRRIGEPLEVEGGQRHSVGVSIGISVFPEHGSDIDVLLSHADHAMYASKVQGRNRYTFCQGPATSADAGALPWVRQGGDEGAGAPELEAQDRQLVTLASELKEAVEAQRSAEVIADLFDQLLYFAQFHFATEARFMEEVGYPERTEHERQHAQLIEELTHIRARQQPGWEVMAVQTLKEWLAHHATAGDAPLGRFIRSRLPH